MRTQGSEAQGDSWKYSGKKRVESRKLERAVGGNKCWSVKVGDNGKEGDRDILVVLARVQFGSVE